MMQCEKYYKCDFEFCQHKVPHDLDAEHCNCGYCDFYNKQIRIEMKIYCVDIKEIRKEKLKQITKK